MENLFPMHASADVFDDFLEDTLIRLVCPEVLPAEEGGSNIPHSIFDPVNVWHRRRRQRDLIEKTEIVTNFTS
jgi:hypothetical protein